MNEHIDEESNTFIRVPNTSFRIELDYTKDDEGIFLWGDLGFIDYEDLDAFISKLTIAKDLIKKEKNRNKIRMVLQNEVENS